ncbi:hypothetical protein RPMA_21330 [Tardiphaga alba]|uniref:Uncharacterized protein n=2 Tax=Tardiphaga alba TaxID=340268 RepID=A0ABX8AGT4_9BRAD|nr:hypothetical protein RPMA_21330 [Tardiphaga alba]
MLSTAAAHADSCNKSREYLLGGLAGDLEMAPQTYDGLFKICVATATMSNVQDAFILKDGGIAVIPKQDTIPATAATLSRFCDANPRATLRFLSKKDLAVAKSMPQIVRLSSTGATSCKQIKGLT